ncbi:hypothetical protein BC941DRAFT_440781 [Chlamydoabsidia padenii]|nr:hypothetical protein BC941DRAFT_440781 [Chlamydoabsidia padenii]
MPLPYPTNRVINQPTKRRMHDDDDDDCNGSIKDQSTKRLNALSQQFSPNNEPLKPEVALPSLTFASPDYRPPPRSDALWLQPVPNSSMAIMEDDSTDEDDVLPNPCYNNNSNDTNNNTLTTKHPNGFEWIMTDQC